MQDLVAAAALVSLVLLVTLGSGCGQRLLLRHGRGNSTFTASAAAVADSSRSLQTDTSSSSPSSIEDVIRARLEVLKKVAESRGRPACGNSHLVTVNEYPYGRSGNNMLELVHGIWLAHVLNGHIRLPHFMRQIISPFDEKMLLDNFCINAGFGRGQGFHMHAVDLLNIHKVFKESRYAGKVPSHNNETIHEVADFYVRVMSSLWHRPSDAIINAAVWLIKNKLGGSLRYTTVHKRYMEGECPDIFRRMSNISDYNPAELPMDHPSWKHLSNISHPLCSMDLDFVQRVQKMNQHADERIFLAHDGYGSIDDFRKVGAVVSEDLDMSQFSYFRDIKERKFVDMFLAIHGDFFILNPRSTYSWYVLVVRTVLGLPSVPIIRNRDLFFYSDEEYEEKMFGKRWVGPSDIVEVVREIKAKIGIV